MERLSLPDTTILQSTSADGAVDSTKLGAELSHGDSLYSDLQTKYYFWELVLITPRMRIMRMRI